jgi:spore germination cell wall hydrolase CwlJ-like protein
MKKWIILTLIALLPIISHQRQLTENQKVAQEFNEQLICMAKNVYYEAGSESYEGKLAVAQVTINRTNNPNFPNTVCGVVYHKTNGTYQFSWVGEKVSEIKNKYAWEESLIVARKALTEHKLHDTIFKTKAMFYHNNQVNPGWKLKYVTKIGNHLFYTRT